MQNPSIQTGVFEYERERTGQDHRPYPLEARRHRRADPQAVRGGQGLPFCLRLRQPQPDRPGRRGPQRHGRDALLRGGLPSRRDSQRKQGGGNRRRREKRRSGDRHGHQHRRRQGRRLGAGGERYRRGEGRLRRGEAEGHHRNLPADGRGEGAGLPGRRSRRRRFRQDLHRLFKGRRDGVGRAADARNRGPRHGRQGRRRHPHPPGGAGHAAGRRDPHRRQLRHRHHLRRLTRPVHDRPGQCGANALSCVILPGRRIVLMHFSFFSIADWIFGAFCTRISASFASVLCR